MTSGALAADLPVVPWCEQHEGFIVQGCEVCKACEQAVVQLMESGRELLPVQDLERLVLTGGSVPERRMLNVRQLSGDVLTIPICVDYTLYAVARQLCILRGVRHHCVRLFSSLPEPEGDPECLPDMDFALHHEDHLFVIFER
ncbi:unnamed protein product [Symbiodinium sp. CCMP2592]|nr:unnamed protein product [Symbiodinium sp. CCMP2592]